MKASKNKKIIKEDKLNKPEEINKKNFKLTGKSVFCFFL